VKRKTKQVVEDYIERSHRSLIDDCTAIVSSLSSALELNKDVAENAAKLLREGAWLGVAPRERSELRRLALKINTHKEGYVE